MNSTLFILSARQMQAADRTTFSKLGVASRAVMETAGRAVSRFIETNFQEALSGCVVVFVGSGNNGGDGFVTARALLELGVSVLVVGTKKMGELKGDARANAKSYFERKGNYIVFESRKTLSAQLSALEPSLIVDAVFGTGLKNAPRGLPAKLIESINDLAAKKSLPVISVDMPSGLNSDSSQISGVVVRADVTLSLQSLKRAHVFYPAKEACGNVYMANIGVDISRNIDAIQPEVFTWQEASEILKKAIPKKQVSHKGKRGKLIAIGGSFGHYGAIKMTGVAALRSGAGLVTIGLPQSVAKKISAGLKELMCDALPDDGSGNLGIIEEREIKQLLKNRTAIVVGPGIGKKTPVCQLLEYLLEQTKNNMPMLIDADGLNVLAQDEKLKKLLHPNVVLTPHSGEMARLMGMSVKDVEAQRVETALSFSKKYKCIVLLKGAQSIIAEPRGKYVVNPITTGALSTAGSGDVLSGIIGAFLSLGLPPAQAAALGAYVHGLSGEYIELLQEGEIGNTALDIANLVGFMINKLKTVESGDIRSIVNVNALTTPPFFQDFLEESVS